MCGKQVEVSLGTPRLRIGRLGERREGRGERSSTLSQGDENKGVSTTEVLA